MPTKPKVALIHDWLYTYRGGEKVLEQFCELLRCELPLRTDLARVQMIRRDVRKHPAVEDNHGDPALKGLGNGLGQRCSLFGRDNQQINLLIDEFAHVGLLPPCIILRILEYHH